MAGIQQSLVGSRESIVGWRGPRRERWDNSIPVTGFHRSNSELLCDDLPLSAIADREGTPVYVYSGALLRERYRALDEAFGAYPHRVHYAMKANSTLALVRLLRDAGAAIDANSVWEIDVARRAGFAPADIVFPG